jgi:hypothetical protein
VTGRRTHPGRLRRVWRCAPVFALAAGLAACATLEHNMSVGEVAGRTLPTHRGEGAERLRAEMEMDVTLKDFVAANGRPEYLHVVDRMSLYFFYVQDDRAVKFERDLLPPSTAQDLGRIPGTLIKMLPKKDVEAIQARRAVVQQRHEVAETARMRASPRKVPAARASGGGYVGNFDVVEIVERLRPPLTAADRGVTGWRTVTFADGVKGSQAKAGANRWEVRSDRIVLAMPLASSRSKPPPGARIEIGRANGAVFGAHAEAVTAHVMDLVARVAADRSGKTPAAQRIRGRLVRIDRVPSDGTLVYSVRP